MKATRVKRSASTLREIVAYFLKMGFLGFGGPLALMAAFQKDLIEDRGWMPASEFARALALIKAMPGPVSTQLTIHLGQVRGGKLGGLIAGICLILPAFLMMILLAIGYNSVEALWWSKPLLFGMQATALGVITESVWRLSAPYRGKPVYWAVALVAIAITSWRQASEPLVIIGAGLLGVTLFKLARQKSTTAQKALSVAPNVFTKGSAAKTAAPAAAALVIATRAPVGTLAQLFLVMLKSGALVFGTGLAIVPLLVHDVVTLHHWLSHQQFMDALAFGQITPGPVVITSTFIGYRVGGLTGATLATLGIFAPSFFNILTWFPWAEHKLGTSPATKHFVMWAVAAVSGSILVTVVRLGLMPLAGGTPPLLIALGVGALAASLFTKWPVWLIIPAGGVIAAVANLFGI